MLIDKQEFGRAARVGNPPAANLTVAPILLDDPVNDFFAVGDLFRPIGMSPSP
jgi:hypothetical protein